MGLCVRTEVIPTPLGCVPNPTCRADLASGCCKLCAVLLFACLPSHEVVRSRVAVPVAECVEDKVSESTACGDIVLVVSRLV